MEKCFGVACLPVDGTAGWVYVIVATSDGPQKSGETFVSARIGHGTTVHECCHVAGSGEGLLFWSLYSLWLTYSLP